MYNLFVESNKDDELFFIDQFVFDKFVKNSSSISYDGIYKKEKKTMNLLSDSNIDGLIIFTVARGGNNLRSFLLSTTNGGTVLDSNLIKIYIEEYGALLDLQEGYTKKVNELTENLVFDLAAVEMFK